MPPIHRKSTTFSLRDVKTTARNLHQYFQNTETFDLVHCASGLNNLTEDCDLASYLNPVHPFLIHIIASNEAAYLNTLSPHEQLALITKLSAQQAQYLIFEDPKAIPATFFQQNNINLVTSQFPDKTLPQKLTRTILDATAERTTIHGAFVVIFGQGILITGDSGSGKSSLLNNLVDQGHLWVADDSPLFYLNSDNVVIGHADRELSEFIHIKGLGPINMDKTHGQACRIRAHPLAALMHLSNNTCNENKNISAYTQRDTRKIFKQNFPMHHFSPSHPNLVLMAEMYAKSLILKQWDYDAAIGLENALNNALSMATDN